MIHCIRTLALSSFLLVVACGGNVPNNNNQVCEGSDAPEACGGDCVEDTDCPMGFYCGNSGCSADCVANGDCTGGRVCNTTGQCVDPATLPDADCPSVAARAEPQTPTVLLLIDRSGSMNGAFDDPLGNPSDRWTEVHRALTNLGLGGGVIDDLEDSVVFGASLYSSDDGDAGGTCPILQSVAASLGNSGPINTLMADNYPVTGADTPSAESLAASYDNFPATLTPTSPRVLVFATDGDPDTCVDPDSNGEQGPRDDSEAAVLAGFGKGIQTYVLSVGDDATQSHLDRMARIGLGQDPATGSATAYVATNAAALQLAFDEIINGTRSCIFDLDGQVTESGAAQGDVKLNGTDLVLGTDWQLNGDAAIELIGDACTTYLESATADLTAEFPCGGFIVE